MLRIHYRHPLTEIYQYEYAVYLCLDRLFHSTSTRSMSIETLRLYYAELVNTNENGNISYKKQIEKEDECGKMIRRDILDKVNLGVLSEIDAKVKINRAPDGRHIFFYDCGAGRRFAVKVSGRYPRKLLVKDLSLHETKGKARSRKGNNAA